MCHASLANLVGGCAVGNRDQDVPQAVSVPVRIGSLTLDCRQIVVDVALRETHLAFDLPPAYLRDHDFLSDFLAEAREVVTVAFEGIPELAQRKTVLLGDSKQRVVESLIIDADAGLACKLQLKPGENQSFEHLLAQRAGGRRCRSRLAKLLAYAHQPNFELALRDDVVVDDGDDSIELDVRRRHGPRVRRAHHGDGARDGACPPSSPARGEERHQNSFS